jgi:diaminohydroxyphosphoribosylaminopyrimidine deaminase/5-amino-6-(5-phosphoribosylamino)uracil reductase
MATDESHLREALDLAAGGRGRVEPNPLVGCVIVKDGRIVGRGFHARYGGPHAEPAALAAAGTDAEGATAYVTLEPCAHEGKTPPCADALRDAGIRRVVFAADDPYPPTAGKGPERLREAGVEVVGGVLAEEARALNPRFASHLESDLPWTLAKWAMTLDGKIADASGSARWVTGPESRRLVHEIRGAVDAVLVGVGTVLADDPDLTVREGEPLRTPVRLVADSTLRTPAGSRLVRTAGEVPVWLACGADAPPDRRKALEDAGCRIFEVGREGAGLDLREWFRTLREEGLHRILLEGGGRLNAAAVSAGLVRQVMAFVAPKIVGGRDAPTPADGEGGRSITEALALTDVTVTHHGPDTLIEGYLD